MKKNNWKIIVGILLIALVFTCAMPILIKDYNAIPTISRTGSQGTEVRNIQTVLKRLGYYNGSIDGTYGSQTKSAVTKFQRDCGLTQDGVCGEKTLLYLGLGTSSGSSSSGGYSANDVQLLAKVISAEARGESYEGQVAVGAVVLNRVAHPSFPNTVSGVVYQSGAFSAVTDSNWSASITDSAKRAAQDALNGWDPSNGAIYYYNPAKTNDKWIRTRPVITTIGSHLFAK